MTLRYVPGFHVHQISTEHFFRIGCLLFCLFGKEQVKRSLQDFIKRTLCIARQVDNVEGM